MLGVIKREHGTGKCIWLVQPLDNNQASIIINNKYSESFTQNDIDNVVEFIVEDCKIGISTFKLAKIVKKIHKK